MIKALVYLTQAYLNTGFGVIITVIYYERRSGDWVWIDSRALDVVYTNIDSRRKMEDDIAKVVLDWPTTHPDIFDPMVWGHFSGNDIVSYISISVGD